MSADQSQAGSCYGRRAWARAMIEKAKGHAVPEYGSVDWLRLPDAHPARIAAVVIAAEAWASSGDRLVSDIEREVDQMRRSAKRAEDEAYAASIEAHREKWKHLAGAPDRPQRGDASVPLEEIGRRYRLEVIEGGRGGGAR